MAGPGAESHDRKGNSGNLGGDSVVDSRKPHAHDVLCGRGGQSNNHAGNEWFRRLVRSNRALYRSCPKHTKLLVAKAIVQAVEQQDPRGRFIKLKENEDGQKDSVWEPITYSQAVNKTSQALREKESRDGNRNKQKPLQLPQQQQQTAQQEALLQETNKKKNLEIAKKAAKSLKVEGAEMSESIANLTNATIQSAAVLLKKSPPTENEGTRQQSRPQKRNMSSQEQLQRQANPMTSGDQKQYQEDSRNKVPQHVGQKRKIANSFVKPCWWRMASSMNGTNTVSNNASNGTSGPNSTVASGTIVTPGIDTDFNHEGSKKRMKILNGVGNADTNERRLNNMGRGVVNQVNNPASSTHMETDAVPFPIETTLGSQQSSMFRFLKNTGIFGRGTSVAVAPPIGYENSRLATDAASFDIGTNADQTQLQNANSSQNPLQSTTRLQHKSWDTMSNLQYQKEQRTSIPSFSSSHRMGKTSVQQLRSQQLKEQQSLLASGSNKVVTSRTGLEDELDDIPTSGLMIMNGHEIMDIGGNATPPPPPKALKTQMSDWLSSFFPSPTNGDGSPENFNHTNNSVMNSLSRDDIDNGGAAIPPPPGGGTNLGRSVSSAIFGLVESPSLLLNSLKSGVTSLFGDSMFSQTSGSPIRRFPSAFQQQQMRQQQQQATLRQQFRGAVSAGGAMIGNHPVLGERATQRSSLLEDFEETPMETELRNAKPEEQSRGARYY